MAFNDRVEDLVAFIKERHRIYLRRQAGAPAPWTNDPILSLYKFCNVYRELDRVTVWIKDNIRDPYYDNPNLWLMLCIARRINWPDTLAEIIADKRGAWPVDDYRPERLLALLDARTQRGDKVYTGSYMVTAEHTPGETKSKATAYSSIGRLWEQREDIAPCLSNTLEEAFNAILGKGFAWGSFMTAQVIADLKYSPDLIGAEDWWDWAASGPGSRRGMNRVFERELDAPWKEENWLFNLGDIRARINQDIEGMGLGWGALHAQDVQNCLCEFDKHERVRLGEGRPRSKFKPFVEQTTLNLEPPRKGGQRFFL